MHATRGRAVEASAGCQRDTQRRVHRAWNGGDGWSRDSSTYLFSPIYPMFWSSLPGLKRMVRPGGMRTSLPVRGLRPMPRFRGFT